MEEKEKKEKEQEKENLPREVNSGEQTFFPFEGGGIFLEISSSSEEKTAYKT